MIDDHITYYERFYKIDGEVYVARWGVNADGSKTYIGIDETPYLEPPVCYIHFSTDHFKSK